jgi:two-component system chemotaxis sensor kinase CheA
VIQGHATDVINVGYFLSKAYGDWFADHGVEDFSDEADEMDSQKHLLIVDDSPFFRNMLTPILGVAGYRVDSAENPIEAMDLLDNGNRYDAIISDIEMPEMSGFQFAEKLKQSRHKHIPLIALTSHATEGDIARGKEVGFENYVAKFDRETLLNALSETLRNAKMIEDKAGVA